jgi:hypothetical protein
MKPFKADKYGRDLVYDDHRDESLVGDIPTSGGYKGKTTFGMMEMTNMGVVEKLVLIMDLFKPMLAGRVASFSTANILSDYSSITGLMIASVAALIVISKK